MKLLLQHKIFIGYFLLMAIIGSMVAIVLHERKRVAEIEAGVDNHIPDTKQYQQCPSPYHRACYFRESVMTWTDKDCELYRTRRLKADSLLQILREQCKEFFTSGTSGFPPFPTAQQRGTSVADERIRQQKQIDSLLAGQYSLVTSQANTSRTVTRKKKG